MSNENPTPDYYGAIYKGVKLDYYRIEDLYKLTGPRGHAVKKLLRGLNKDDGVNTEQELIEVIRGQLNRWEQMLIEDSQPIPCQPPLITNP